jgi:2-phosphosulfolactate phosphatase
VTGELRTVERLEDLPDPAPEAPAFVVVDVIISSTSIVRLLEAGATSVRPFADVDDALAFKEETGAVLVGEQGGRPVEGFDGSPLPSLVRRRDLERQPVGILTSNGTRAMDRIGHDREILVGSTVNARAVAAVLRERDGDAWLVAAGRGGDPVPEDLAGVELIERCYRDELSATAEAEIGERIESCGTAAWLRDLGFEHEVEDLLAFNSSETVPELRDGAFVA